MRTLAKLADGLDGAAANAVPVRPSDRDRFVADALWAPPE
jgi:hypothetical protein